MYNHSIHQHKHDTKVIHLVIHLSGIVTYNLPEFADKWVTASRQICGVNWDEVICCRTFLPLSPGQYEHLEEENSSEWGISTPESWSQSCKLFTSYGVCVCGGRMILETTTYQWQRNTPNGRQCGRWCKLGKVLYSIVFSPQDCSKHFTRYFPADLFNQTPSQPLLEASSHAAINALRLLIQISTTVYSQVLSHTAEWTGAMQSEKLPKICHTAAAKDLNLCSLSWEPNTLTLTHNALTTWLYSVAAGSVLGCYFGLLLIFKSQNYAQVGNCITHNTSEICCHLSYYP